MLCELSVRWRESGGPVAPQVNDRARGAVLGRSRIVVLVHGYNVRERGARATYAAFEPALRACYADGGPRVPAVLCSFFWPGDAGWGWLSPAAYPGEIKPARDSAARLAAFLRDLYGPGRRRMQVDFYGHSLGCRVVLETLLALEPALAGLRIYFGVVCLTAAAVELEMLEPGERLHPPLLRLQSRHLLVLHSLGDWVLNLPFRYGQRLAHEGRDARALGRHGPPAWLRAPHHAIDDLRHGDYWRDRRSLTFAASSLGLGPVPQSLSAHALAGQPANAHEMPIHQLPEA